MNAALQTDPAVNVSDELRKRFRPNQICNAKALDLHKKIWTRLKR